jgi:nucleotide sugar dehydrogenase
MKQTTIGVIGLGYIGQPTVVALANVGYRVVGMDIDAEKIALLQGGNATLYEPGLSETLRRCQHLIHFTTSYEEVMAQCEAVLITVGTPIGADNAPDMRALNTVVQQISAHLRPGQTVILRSTVTPGTTVAVSEQIEEISGLKCGADFFCAFCPERTIEGLALYELNNLPKIIGGINPASTERTAEILKRLGGKVVKVSSASVAELCKLADNMYRALNIAFANEFGLICETAGEDAYEVVGAVNSTYNRTSIFRPGLGAGGPCLSKDPVILSYFANGRGVATPIVDACVSGNLAATRRPADEALRFIAEQQLNRPRIAILGLSFKGSPETDDPRGAPALDIYRALLDAGKVDGATAHFSFFDPLVRQFAGQQTARSIEECISGAHVVLLLTDHAMLRNLSLPLLLKYTARPALILDAWHNIVDVDYAELPNDVNLVQIGSAVR